MSALFYRFITLFSRYFGRWFFMLFSRFVSTAYFVLFPRRVAVGLRFYRALFPEKSRILHLLCTWRQFHGFTNVFLDRFLLETGGTISYESEGWEMIEEAARSGKGAILLMSHMGNWDVAAHLLREQGLRLMLFMGSREKEQIEKLQKKDLSLKGVSIVAVDREGGSPLDILEGKRFLDQGGVVSLTGDRLWTANQRSVPVRFLGHRVRLPEAPHALALASGAPIYVFFAFRVGAGRYRISASGPLCVAAAERRDRARAVAESAQRYADILAEKARAHPLQWYHFEEFLGEGLG
jgi:predicted LPLAT superfamily acyltransferase